MQPERSFLSPGIVAERLAVSPDTVYRLIRRGELGAVRAGRRYVVPDEALREFLERGEREDVERLFQRTLELGRIYLERAHTETPDAYFELAVAKLKRAVTLRPVDPLPRYELVRALLLWGKEEEAQRAFGDLQDAQEGALEGQRRERRVRQIG